MTDYRSWLRRARRTLRVCTVSALLLVLWSFVEGIASLARPTMAGPSLLFLGALFVWWHWTRPRRLQRRRGPADLRLRKLPRAAIGHLGAGIVVACLALEAIFQLHLRFLPVPATDPFAEMFEMIEQPWGWLPLFLMVIALAPIIEETVFRGWIQRPLERLWGAAPAVAISAVLFSAVHFIPEYFPFYIVVGVVLGTVVVLTRSLWASIALHAAFNIQGTIVSLLTGGEFAEEVAFARLPGVIAVSAIVLFGSGMFLWRTAPRLRAAARPRGTRVAPVGGQPEAA